MSLHQRRLALPDSDTSRQLVAVLRRAAEQFDEDTQRFLAKAYREAAYSAEEHHVLVGTQILLACDALEYECRLMSKAPIPEHALKLKHVALLLHDELCRA